MDLRTPNRKAVEAVATRIEEAGGDPIEVVCNLATAVGKTYLAGALMDYLAIKGVRNFLFVVPNTTVLNKTIDNFTPGHPKSILGGMSTKPLVVTTDNFIRGEVGAALRDRDQVKLFIFTVQSLTRPDRAARRVRKLQEWLGDDLYEHLRRSDDLIVIADEHHLYSQQARKFSEAIRDLGALALVGLTATPTDGDKDKVIFTYSLAEAIHDRYVKTPVLVGREDEAGGVETRLRDAKVLLDAKQRAADAYASAMGLPPVRAVMFVIARDIDHAGLIAEVLRKPGLFADDHQETVLTVHSEVGDAELARLAAVEDPDSKVRVIVQVAMLGVGWDVKSIFVICSFRPSVSEVLTEQTLGRGLRLPWGRYTDVEMLDTVEVLSHESYRELLSRAGTLLEGLVVDRAAAFQPDLPAGIGVSQDRPGPLGVNGAAPASGVIFGGDSPVAPAPSIADFGDRVRGAEVAATQLSRSIVPRASLTIPILRRTLLAKSFDLSTVDRIPFVAIGEMFAQVDPTNLERKLLTVEADPSSPSGLRLVPRDAADVVEATKLEELPLGSDPSAVLLDGFCSLDIVDESTKAGIEGARRLVEAVIEGAGSPEALSAYLTTVLRSCRMKLRDLYRAAPEERTDRIESVPFDEVRATVLVEEANRNGPFSDAVAYSGWSERSLFELNWFDSEPERAVANLLDKTGSGIDCWVRLAVWGQFSILWTQGRYYPDFYARSGDEHFVIEVKADNQMTSDEVQAKATAARHFVEMVNAQPGFGHWTYLLISQSTAETARSWSAAVQQASVS